MKKQKLSDQHYTTVIPRQVSPTNLNDKQRPRRIRRRHETDNVVAVDDVTVDSALSPLAPGALQLQVEVDQGQQEGQEGEDGEGVVPLAPVRSAPI